MSKKKRILLAKTGLDGHTRGIKIVARALMEAGFEVIYTGIRLQPDQVVQAALDEDVDAVGLSSLSGGHLEQFPEVARKIRKDGSDGILLFGGGIIPDEDRTFLESAGFARIFGPGTSTGEIVRFLSERLEVASGEGC
ncbi:MAG: cobalamin B12-binding domain-containing protein [Planctomycetota bacterium]|nr:cobalamin B12-binding domain-containing protein [Planctomycetota bacterium]